MTWCNVHDYEHAMGRAAMGHLNYKIREWTFEEVLARQKDLECSLKETMTTMVKKWWHPDRLGAAYRFRAGPAVPTHTIECPMAMPTEVIGVVMAAAGENVKRLLLNGWFWAMLALAAAAWVYREHVQREVVRQLEAAADSARTYVRREQVWRAAAQEAADSSYRWALREHATADSARNIADELRAHRPVLPIPVPPPGTSSDSARYWRSQYEMQAMVVEIQEREMQDLRLSFASQERAFEDLVSAHAQDSLALADGQRALNGLVAENAALRVQLGRLQHRAGFKAGLLVGGATAVGIELGRALIHSSPSEPAHVAQRQ